MHLPARFRPFPALLLACLLAACGGPDLMVRTSSGTRSLQFADAALSGGMPQAALNATRAVLERDPRNVRALLQQGDALAVLGRGDAAAEAYRRVLDGAAGAAERDVRRAQLGAGRAELASGRAEKADAVFRAYVEANPRDGDGRTGLGVALDMQGRHREAQREYRAALALAESDTARVNLGLSLALAGDAQEAVQVLRPLAQASDAPLRVRHNLAFALATAGDRVAAERILAPDLPRAQVAAAMAGFNAVRTAAP